MLDLSFMPPSSPDAEALGKAYFLFHENITKVCTFRAVAIAGLEVGAAAAQEQFFKDIATSALKTQLGAIPEAMFSRLKALVLERKRSDAAASSDAACLILAHSVFEALVHELIDILPSTRREVILKNIGERKIPICDLVAGGNLDQLLAAEVLRYVSELKRESLRKKLAFIFDCCGFDKSCQEPGYSFDQEQLIAIDKERQQIIHHSIFGQRLIGIESTLTFLLHTGDFLVCLVSRGTGLEVNVRSSSMPLAKCFDESRAFRTVTSLVGSVNDAMERWADWVVTGHGAQAQADKVRAVYLEYQEVMNTVFNSVQQLKANTAADGILLNDAVTQADSAAQTVIQLIESLLSAGQSTAAQTDAGAKP